MPLSITYRTKQIADSDIFTGALYNEYANPTGFCFDILCDDEPIIDDENSPDYNIDKKVVPRRFLKSIAHRMTFLLTSVIIGS